MSDTYYNTEKGMPFDVTFIDAPGYLKEYLVYIKKSGRKESTAHNYYIQIRDYLRWLKLKSQKVSMTLENFQSTKIADVPFEIVASATSYDIEDYITSTKIGFVSLKGREGYSKATKALKLSSIRSFYYFLETKKHWINTNPTNAVEFIKERGKRLPVYLTKEEAIRLIEAVAGQERERDICIITFFINTGIRVGELYKIKLTDIKEERLVVRGKGDKERVVYLNQACMEAMHTYLTIREAIPGVQMKGTPYLFVSKRSGELLTIRRVEQIVEATAKRAGLTEKIHPHKLRHTAATLLYQEAGADLLTLQEILGHEKLETTRIYTQLADGQVRDTMLNSPLLGRKGDTP